MTLIEDTTAVAVRVARAFEKAGVDYAVGGSVASSAYGEPRATRDVDFAIRLTSPLVTPLVDALGRGFVVDEEMLTRAIESGDSVNIFYLPVFTKVDLFVRGDDAYDRAEFSRRTEIEPVPGERILASSPEDNLLWKLRWFRRGGEISDQQWRDVLGILRSSRAAIDFTYLRRWSEHHEVEDLFERAVQQAPL